MKYMLTWHERPQGSAEAYELVQKRILATFRHWVPPEGFSIQAFVIRLGEWGGHMLVECPDPTAVHKFCSTFPAFAFEVHQVLDVADAVRVELEAIAWRDELDQR